MRAAALAEDGRNRIQGLVGPMPEAARTLRSVYLGWADQVERLLRDLGAVDVGREAELQTPRHRAIVAGALLRPPPPTQGSRRLRENHRTRDGERPLPWFDTISLRWAATQRPDAKSLPTGISADAVLRRCLKVQGQVENDMVLGTSAYKNGTRATMFSRKDRRHRPAVR